MTEITHDKAHALLDVAADRSLGLSDQARLDAHLAACQECRTYAGRLADLENGLSRTLHAKWDKFRPDLNLQAIQNPSPAKLVWYNFFSQTNALGKVAIMATLLLGYIVMINLVGIRVPITDNETPTALPTPNSFTMTLASSPTLLARSASVDSTSLACELVVYIVRENDTLESIAVQHGITVKEILAYNDQDADLTANALFTGMELVIPQCEGGPTRTASLPSKELTITPINGTLFPDHPE